MNPTQKPAPRRPDGTITDPQKGRLQLPRKGKIKLGIKKQKPDPRNPGKFIEYPAEVNYFVCPPEVQAIYGKEPTELDILLPVNEEKVVFFQAYKWYGGNQAVKCMGNGVFAIRSFRDLDAEQKKEFTEPMQEFDKVEVACPCPMLNVKGGCDKVATLSFFIPKASVAGVYQIDVKSEYSIRNIEGGLAMTRAMTMGPKFPGGTIAMIPMKLTRRPQKILWQGKMNTHHIVNLEHQLNHEDVLKYKYGGEVPMLESDHPAAIDAPQHPGATASSFTEAAGSSGVVEEVETGDQLDVLTVVVKSVEKNPPTALGDSFTIQAIIAPPANPDAIVFVTKSRDLAATAFKGIKLETPMNVWFKPPENVDEIPLVEKIEPA